MNLSLKGKTALVSGSTKGIGRACAEELASMGADIVLLARNEDELKKISVELSDKYNINCTYLIADFSDSTALKKALEGNKNPYHILINNTGGPAAGPIHTAKVEEFESAFHNHLLCNHILATNGIEFMKSEKYGRIINIISTSVKQPLPNLGVSNTIRAAVANWAKTLASEVGQYAITVNNVLPGATATERLSSIITNKSSKTSKPYEEVEKEMLSEIPMKRFAEASEIANAVAFIASPAAGYINGINLPVDGGRTGNL